MPPRVRVVGREPGVEQGLLLLSALLAIACLVGGVYLAEIRADPHWLNRAGAAIPASQCVVLAAEFARRSRLASLAPVTVDRGGSPATALNFAAEVLEYEVRRAEKRLLMWAACYGVAGELLHGFGDMLWELLGA